MFNNRTFFVFVVDGICEGLPAGKIRIELYVDDNARDTTGASSPVAHTGWNAVNRFIVEEIRLRHDVNACTWTLYVTSMFVKLYHIIFPDFQF